MTCSLCGVVVGASLADVHRRFHIAHDLHGPDCHVTEDHDAQSRTGAYIYPRPCSCDLREFHRQNREVRHG